MVWLPDVEKTTTTTSRSQIASLSVTIPNYVVATTVSPPALVFEHMIVYE